MNPSIWLKLYEVAALASMAQIIPLPIADPVDEDGEAPVVILPAAEVRALRGALEEANARADTNAARADANAARADENAARAQFYRRYAYHFW